MRLRDVLGYLSSHKNLKVNDEEAPNAHPTAFRLTNRPGLLHALQRLSKVEPLRDLAENVMGMPMMTSPSVLIPERDRFRAEVRDLAELASTLETLVAGTLPEQDPESIAIRLPEPENLDDLKDLMGDLHLVFEQPVRRFFGPEAPSLRFQNFDTGSSWVELYGYAGIPLKFVFGILFAGQFYRKQEAAIRLLEADARIAEAKTDVIETMAKGHKALLEIHLKQQAKQLAEAYAAHRDQTVSLPETLGFIENGVKTWAALEDRGATARPALTAPKEVTDFFPDPDLSASLFEEKKVKLLKAASEAEPESGETGNEDAEEAS